MAGMRSYAIVPAAGASARMGAHKLLMPLGGQTVIDRVLASWRQSEVTRVVVVVRAADSALLERCIAAGSGVDVVAVPTAPRDMKASALLALQYVAAHYSPDPNDAWLLAPADLPRLSSAAINAVLAAYDPARPSVVAAAFEGERGHPLLMPWALAERVGKLAADAGVNAILEELLVREVVWGDDSILRDVDTPGDFACLLESFNCS
jgi:molybdenum cofactor cytidylyltransferase